MRKQSLFALLTGICGAAAGQNLTAPVGIGTTSPQAPLHIVNNQNLVSLVLEGNSAGWGSGLTLRNTAASGKHYGIYSSAYGGLHFSDNLLGVDRMVFNSAGHVGIGTSLPLHQLHTVGDGVFQQKLESTAGFSGLMMKSSTATRQFGIHYGSDGSSGLASNSLRFGRYSLGGDQPGNGWEANPVLFDLDAPGNSLVLSDQGNIGVGVFSPWARMDIRTNGLNAGDQNALNIQNPSGDAWSTVSMIMSTGPTSAMISAQRNNLANGSSLYFFTSDQNGTNQIRMRIGSEGSVGIGTNNISDANYKLFVETGIRTRKVKVDLDTWPDYVFSNDYRLRPLSEVESYISRHKHLPDVPSADEVKKEGLDLGENQATLLKKIEELTLYIIEQQKEIKELKKEMQELKRSNEK